jgi:hypothetical protein
MATYLVPLPPAMAPTEDTPMAITEWLAARGYAVSAVSIRGEAPAAVAVIDIDRDPTADLAAYDGTPSAERRRIKQLAQTALAYAQAVEAGQTPTAAQTVAAVRATIRLLQVAYRDLDAE